MSHDSSMQLVKQHNNLQMYPNAASIITGIGLDNIWLFQLSPSYKQLRQCQILIKLTSRSITTCFKTKKHEAFHSLTVAVFSRNSYCWVFLDAKYCVFDSQKRVWNPVGSLGLAKRGSYMVWEINMGVCPRLEFDNIM